MKYSKDNINISNSQKNWSDLAIRNSINKANKRFKHFNKGPISPNKAISLYEYCNFGISINEIEEERLSSLRVKDITVINRNELLLLADKHNKYTLISYILMHYSLLEAQSDTPRLAIPLQEATIEQIQSILECVFQPTSLIQSKLDFLFRVYGNSIQIPDHSNQIDSQFLTYLKKICKNNPHFMSSDKIAKLNNLH